MNPDTQNQQPQAPAGPSYPGAAPTSASYSLGVPAPGSLPNIGGQPAMPMMPGQTPPMGIPQPTPSMPPVPPAMQGQPPAPAPSAPPTQQGQTLIGQINPNNLVQPAAMPGPQAVTGSAAAGPNPGVKPAAPQLTNPNSTQNMLQIAEIRDGIVIMNDGSFRSVVMVNSINFDLMSPQEQEAVEYNYQNFLNSLYFPIQIFLRSQKVDLSPYIEKLDKIRSEHDNMLLALLMEDYITYMEVLAQQTNIMDKKFYIVVPFFPHVDIQKAFTQSKNFITGITALFDKKEHHVTINESDLEKAKTELRNRVQTIMDGLMQCGVQSLPLDTKELIELFYDTYNPDTATRQQLKNFSNTDADIVTKGQGKAPQPHLERELV